MAAAAFLKAWLQQLTDYGKRLCGAKVRLLGDASSLGQSWSLLNLPGRASSTCYRTVTDGPTLARPKTGRGGRQGPGGGSGGGGALCLPRHPPFHCIRSVAHLADSLIKKSEAIIFALVSACHQINLDNRLGWG